MKAPASDVVPRFVAVGNAARDVVPGGWRLGGTVTFAAVQADRLGLAVGVAGRTPRELRLDEALPFAQVRGRPADSPVSFENVYRPEGRTQRLISRGETIDEADVPGSWLLAPIVLLGPVFGEIGPGLAARFAKRSLVGLSAQGWVRGADADGRVRHEAWAGEPYWSGADVLFASDEDLAGDEAELQRWTSEVRIVAVTRSSRGARVFVEGERFEMAAYPSREVDATGAGDVFATGFLVRLHETRDVDEAARFGAAAASLAVEGVGVEAIAGREGILERMAAHPEVRLSSA